MAPAFKILARTIFPAILGLTLSSCAALNMFKGSVQEEAVLPAPPVEEKSPAQETAAVPEGESLTALESKIHTLEDKVSTLETQVAGQKKIIYAMEYSDPVQLYQKARSLLLENDQDSAADLFATFAKQHPEHGLADNALYWLGECHYTKGRYDKAVEVFKQLVNTYPKAEKVPDALLKTGYAYLSMDDVNRASHFLKLVIKKYPFSPAAEKAEAKLSTFD